MLGRLIQPSPVTHLETQENTDKRGRVCFPVRMPHWRYIKARICRCQASHPEPQSRHQTRLTSHLRGDLEFTLPALIILLFFSLSLLTSVGTHRFLLAALLLLYYYSIKCVIDLGNYCTHAKKPSQHAVMMCIVVSMEMR